MRKLFLFSILCLILQTEVIYDENQLLDITATFEKNNMNVKKWDVIHKDKVNNGDLDELITYFKLNKSTIDIKENSHTLYTFKNKVNKNDITVTYELIVPMVNHKNANFNVTIGGFSWSDSIKSDYLRQRNVIAKQFISDSSRTFTCVTAIEDGIIENGASFNFLYEDLNVLHNLTQFDNISESKYEREIYGFTPLWKNEIKNENDKINVQLVVKHEEDRKNSVTIGTPIILNEY